MGYSWTEGEEVTAEKLNKTGDAPALLNWYGMLFSSTGFPSFTSAFVMTQDGKVMLGGETTSWRKWTRLHEGMPPRRDATAVVSSLTITPNMAVSLYDGATEYVLACATGGTDVYRYDSDGTNEALCTISGTAIGTGATRMGYDPSTGYVYIMDGSDKASTTIRRYTFTGTTLTFVDTITLSTAPLNLGRTQMWIGANYIVIEQDTNNSLDFHRYGKDSGTEIEASMAYNFSTTQQSGQYLRHPVNLAGYLVTEIQAGADVNIFFIKFSPDDLPF